ncbi:hypothetical protein EGW08_000389 [Elysia chlorotica]|uniref:protein-tyrosine-phosphatase n=1 Tax=Elysia chlorotica TaxID=188477 RepID=A0A3S1BMP4_ELYCH|nr:hypothetical protein EGW08_000389 [Elysia chlorotica]
MAEFGAHENREPSPNREVYRAADGGQGSAYPPQSAARARRKLGRGDSKNWFNKSFDQAVLASKSKPQRVMRRQNSVTDFFHSMLTKSKSHLQDIFASKKEKASRRCGGSKETSPFHLPRENSESLGAEAGGRCSTSNEQLSESMKGASPYNSGSVFRGDSQVSPIRILHPTLESQPVNANSDAEPASGRSLRKSSNDKEQMSPILPTSNMERFLMSKALNHNRSLSYNSPGKLLTSPVRGQHNAIVKRSSLSSSAERPTALCERETGDTSSPVTAAARRKQMAQSASLSPSKSKGPRTVVTLSSYDSTDSTEEDGERGDGDRARRSVSSAPAGRLSTCWDGPAYPSLLQAGKRTLVKSNSDTLARLESSSMAYLSSSSPQLMYKASSERGGPGNRSLTQFLASGTKNIGTVMIRVTDYLFLGSVEAAYNEPMLCKYDISSLIDMTNVNPALVPAHKKSDCPCACVANKTPHFRSKLNIGVDDIEWENLEQYFDEINSFINAARRKDRRVLVFSYMGQSRAAAAVVQHLMTHFKMPYEDAMKVVRSKRPQIKLNSGFVKALRRLEKRLGLTPEGDGALKEKFGLGEELERREGSPVVSRGSVEAIEKQSPPHVVRGAWLEC